MTAVGVAFVFIGILLGIIEDAHGKHIPHAAKVRFFAGFLFLTGIMLFAAVLVIFAWRTMP